MLKNITKRFLRKPNKISKKFSMDVNNETLKLHSLRKDYKSPELKIEDFDKNPFKQFKNWINLSFEIETGIEPQAMAISTCCPETLQPSSRFVLLKELQDGKFKFFTNLNSRKSKEISKNDKASGLFYWPLQNRSVRIEGRIEKLGEEEDKLYFNSRPVLSRISGTVSPQSKVVTEEELQELRKRFWEIKEEHDRGENPVERPDYWGGYGLVPHRIEFWQGMQSRFHYRFLYNLDENGNWKLCMLAP